MSTFYDPSVSAATNISPAPRPRSLAGKVIGLYDNTKEQADIILEAVGAELKHRHGVKETLNFRGIHYSKPAPMETIEEMARKCDIVICAVGA
ncbi:MAG: hypothetical protein HYY78_16950 [Betaproteobacteria bacterium]|nr:hypothetical protein [Betaproteobacteria bacterium]